MAITADQLPDDGSRPWRSFEDYLLPRPIFTLMRAERRLGLAIPDSFAEWQTERTATLDSKLKELAKAAAANAIPDAAISNRACRSRRSAKRNATGS